MLCHNRLRKGNGKHEIFGGNRCTMMKVVLRVLKVEASVFKFSHENLPFVSPELEVEHSIEGITVSFKLPLSSTTFASSSEFASRFVARPPCANFSFSASNRFSLGRRFKLPSLYSRSSFLYFSAICIKGQRFEVDFDDLWLDEFVN